MKDAEKEIKKCLGMITEEQRKSLVSAIDTVAILLKMDPKLAYRLIALCEARGIGMMAEFHWTGYLEEKESLRPFFEHLAKIENAQKNSLPD